MPISPQPSLSQLSQPFRRQPFLRAVYSDHTTPIQLLATFTDPQGTVLEVTEETRAAGIPVAKHGNRSFSSTSETDYLEALGVTFDISPAGTMKMLDDINMAFFFGTAKAKMEAFITASNTVNAELSAQAGKTE